LASPRRSPQTRASAAAPRWAAALAVRDVLGSGRSLDEALQQRLQQGVAPRDHGLAREMAYGVLRHLPPLQALAAALLQKPLKERDLDVQCLLLAGLYQLLHLRVPAHAAVAETVAAARLLDKPWACGLLNAVLRGFERRRAELLEALAHDEASVLAFPDWLLQALRRCWPEDWRALVEQSNQRPPLSLRVNRVRLSRAEYASRLAEAGILARPLPHNPDGLLLERALEVQALPGFAEGWVSVQDGAAQLAAPLLQPQAGQQVLDACAAPGGKSAHLLELAPEACLTAVDVKPGRVRALAAGLQRLGLSARLLCADMSDPSAAWADREYDKILLDAPCSATGVIRRHPDIKWLRRASDIAPLVQLQRRILDSAWSRLAPGGVLLYVTCALLAEENQIQIQAFLARTPAARELPIKAEWGRALTHGRQVLTGSGQMDGFYFARLQKPAQGYSG
jgi:16S rRNA (cytosine967-C5)-methyltransferase